MDYHRKELRSIKNQIRDAIDPWYLDDNCCKFCWEKSSYKMTVHHRRYIENDIVYDDYPNTIEGRIRYYYDLLPLVRKEPQRFLYICIKCHNILEYYLQFGNKLEDEIIKELAKRFSDFQYKTSSKPFIAKFALKELKLDIDGKLAKLITDRPNQININHKKTDMGDFFK